MKKKQFIVVGVGRFGLSVIETLSRQGVEVLAIERNEEKLEQIADIVVQAVCADAADPEVLGQIGARNFDGAVVTMGKELETSILVTIQLKELGIPYVMVKATNALGGRVLKKVGADKVIFPEREMGIRVGNELASGNYFEAKAISEEHSIVDIPVREEWAGKKMEDLPVYRGGNIGVIGVRTEEGPIIFPEPGYVIRETDILIVLGENQRLRKFQ